MPDAALVSEIDPAAMAGHVTRCIRRGDRHDTILCALAVDQTGERCNWFLKDPAYYQHRWVSSDELEQALAAAGHKTRALSTVISLGCRPHLERRWPGWTIKNKQTRVAGLVVSSYRIERRLPSPADRPQPPAPKPGPGRGGGAGVQPKLFDDRRRYR